MNRFIRVNGVLYRAVDDHRINESKYQKLDNEYNSSNWDDPWWDDKKGVIKFEVGKTYYWAPWKYKIIKRTPKFVTFEVVKQGLSGNMSTKTMRKKVEISGNFSHKVKWEEFYTNVGTVRAIDDEPESGHSYY